MQNKNTRRGHTQIVVNKNCHSRGMLSGIYAFFNNTRRRFPSPADGKSGMTLHLIPPHPAFGLPLPQRARETTRGFTPSRHAELVSASSRYDNNKALKQVQGDGKRGFTLIELLVVVLIIGILAAVALPQYQLAVAKARVAAILPMLKSITQANYAYYLANGELTENVNKLDISLSGDCASTTYTGTDPNNGQIWKCGTYWVVDNSGGESVIANYCPGNNQTWNTCALTRIFRVYTQWSPTTGYKVDCHPLNDSSFGQKVCNSLALN